MQNSKSGTFNMLYGFARGSKRFFALAIIAAAFSILFNFLMPQIVSVTVDSIIGTEPFDLPNIIMNFIDRLGGRDGLRNSLIFCAVGIVACAVLSGLCNFAFRISLTRGTENFAKRMRDTLFAHTQRLPFSWHVETQTGDIIQRCTSDVEQVRNFISAQLIDVIRTVILIVVALALMFSMNVKLAVAAGIFIPVIVIYSIIFFGKISKKFLKADEAEGEVTVKVQENLTGVRVVRAFGRERYEVERFDEKNEAYSKKWIDLGYLMGTYWGMGDFATGLQFLTVTVFGSYLAASGQLTLGQFLVFISYTQTLTRPVRLLGRTISEMSKAGVSIKRVKEILDTPAETDEEDAKKPDLAADIRFENVSFSYTGLSVLKNISFTVEKGETVGILGATGSGKSTLTYLLNRLYDLDENCGKITIGGVDIREIDKQHLRRNVGLVLQEPFLFSKTILENIQVASDKKDLNAVRRSASIAAVDDNIMGFSNGYDTIVGERGVTLSGGQKQRIAIARTLLQEAPIMIFDDSLSAVDMETDAKIRDSLRENTGGATVLLISHRISTLMHADKIIVLENGVITESGSHEELLTSGGFYSRIYNIQSDAGSTTEGGVS